MRFSQQEYQESAEGKQTENAIFCRDAEESVMRIAEVVGLARRRQIVNGRRQRGWAVPEPGMMPSRMQRAAPAQNAPGWLQVRELQSSLDRKSTRLNSSH